MSHQLSVIDESNALRAQILNLMDFIDNSNVAFYNLPNIEQKSLIDELQAMLVHFEILNARINRMNALIVSNARSI